MQEPTDSELVIAIRNGDIFAFEQLVKRYQRGLFSFAYRFVFDAAVAEEIVQDSLYKVYIAIDRVDPEKKFSTYLFEITKNTAISVLRSRKKTVSLEQVTDMAQDWSIYEQLNRTDEQDQVHRAVHKLPEKYQRVITLYYFDELSYEEISKRIHVPMNTVRTHLLRAKEQLKRMLQHENT